MKSWLGMYLVPNEGKAVKIKIINILLQNDIVNKYNNSYHRTTEKNPADVKPSILLTLIKKIIRKVLNLKLVFM